MRVVCFDLGGVLVEINHHWKGALLDVGLPEEMANKFDHPLTDFEPFNQYQRGAMEFEEYRMALEAHFGAGAEGRGAHVHNAILRHTYPGIPELIADVRAGGLMSGCLSNTNAPHWETMFHEPRLAVLATLDYPVASHLVGAEKPDAAMYEAFETASDAKPEDIAYFDDAYGNVEAALGRGWRAFRVDPQGHPAAQMRRHLAEIGFLK